MQAFTVYAVCRVHTLFYGFGIDGLGEAVADYTSYTVFHGLWLRGWGLDLGKAKTMKSLLYGTSGINRLKLLRFMRLYGFLQLGDRRPGGSFCRLYGFIRFILCFTVWDRRPGEASADDTALYGVLF